MKLLLLIVVAVLGFTIAEGVADEVPRHLVLARELIELVSPERNAYFARPTHIVWPDEADESKPASNASVCSSFCTALLRKAYQLDGSEVKELFTEEWPEADEFFVGVSTRREFEVVSTLEESRPGDFLVIDYQSEKEIPTGHVMLISGTPKSAGSHPSKQLPFSFHKDVVMKAPAVKTVFEWHLPVIDSSKGPHGKEDSRYRAVSDKEDDDGIGEGPLRVLADRDGKLLGYTWSTFANSRLWLVEDRPMVIARWKF